MRRLPVYILADTSHSMRGKPISIMNKGLDELLEQLIKDPLLMEILHLSIIEFNTNPSQLVELSPVYMISNTEFTAQGRTNLGAALKFLEAKLKEDVIFPDKNKEVKGDYKPIIYLLTDGGPTDAWINSLKKLKLETNPTIISFGLDNSNRKVLNRISGVKNVVDLSEFESGISTFFELVSQSISTRSRTIRTSEDMEETGIKDLHLYQELYINEEYF